MRGADHGVETQPKPKQASRRAARWIGALALAACFQASHIDPPVRTIETTRSISLGGHSSIHVYGVILRSAGHRGRSGFGCFGAPYPRFRWERADTPSDMFDTELGIIPGDQSAPPDASHLVFISPGSLDGSARNLASARARFAALDVVACTDPSGRYAIAWGLRAGISDGMVTIIGLEPGTRPVCRGALGEITLPPESATWTGSQQCAWLAAHPDQLDPACRP
jgi:hypothetical protein